MKKHTRAHNNALLTSALLSASALAQSPDPVANAAYSLAQSNYNAIHQLATGTNNCYSAYAVSQAYYNANYYNAQIERGTAVMERHNARICAYLEGKR